MQSLAAELQGRRASYDVTLVVKYLNVRLDSLMIKYIEEGGEVWQGRCKEVRDLIAMFNQKIREVDK